MNFEEKKETKQTHCPETEYSFALYTELILPILFVSLYISK
jgi:hypothetical protein